MYLKCLFSPNSWHCLVVLVDVLIFPSKVVQSVLLLVASKALPWMLYEMSAAGLLEKKIKPA